jgi:2',3'-cyclic-nucleotide 2'-phosphodiesterase / 3'-nucleotidase
LPAWRRWLAQAAALLLIAAATGAALAQTTELRLRLLHTTDVHVHLAPYDYYQDKPSAEYGLALTATLIKAARAEARNTLLFDNGDLLQGSPLGDYVAKVKPPPAGSQHVAHRVMQALGYDAANVGNHEFNYGLPFLDNALANAGFPYVNANIVRDDGSQRGGANAYRPWVMLERRFVDEAGAPHTLKIGVIGFVPPQVMQWDKQNLQGRVKARDIAETAREFVPRIKAAGADVIVAIPHSGFERGETVFFAENAVARLAEIEGIDAILFGHSHGEFPGRFFANHPKVDLSRGTINGVPAVMPGRWGDHLGVIDLTLQRSGSTAAWKVSDARAALRPVYDREKRQPLVQPDAQVMALIKPEHEGTLAYIRAEVARSAAPIHSYFAQVADDPSVQIVSEAQLAYARRALAGTPHDKLPLLSAAAPFKTGGRQGWTAYTDIPAGPIALRNVADLYVYPNTVKVVKLSGAAVREWLEMAAGAFNRIDPAGAPEQMLVNTAFPSFNFDTLDGLNYRIDVTQAARYDRAGKLVAPASRRIVGLSHAGQPVADGDSFLVVTNNYRASGGGNFPGLDGSQVVLDAPDENREALVQYLQSKKNVDPSADANWRFVPVAGVKLRFVSGLGAIAHLPRYPQIKLVRENGDGSALFELVP